MPRLDVDTNTVVILLCVAWTHCVCNVYVGVCRMLIVVPQEARRRKELEVARHQESIDGTVSRMLTLLEERHFCDMHIQRDVIKLRHSTVYVCFLVIGMARFCV